MHGHVQASAANAGLVKDRILNRAVLPPQGVQEIRGSCILQGSQPLKEHPEPRRHPAGYSWVQKTYLDVSEPRT